MPITALPTPPSRDDPATFATRADTFLGALPTFVTEANALQSDVNTKQSTASTAASNAAASALDAQTAAATAAQAASSSKWVSGTTYAEGAAVWSPITYAVYRRKSAGAGTTDPSQDTANWAQISSISQVFDFASSGTFTKPASCSYVMVELIGGGGGGGGGDRRNFDGSNPTQSYGGGGGGGSTKVSRTFKASDLTSTVSVTVGAGGTGGAARTTNGDGNVATDGGNSTFGAYLTAFGGRGAGQVAGQRSYTSGGGAGVISKGTTFQSTLPNNQTTVSIPYNVFGTTGAGSNVSYFNYGYGASAEWGGAAGGSGEQIIYTSFKPGGSSIYGCGGGGAGGTFYFDGSTNYPTAGGAGGAVFSYGLGGGGAGGAIYSNGTAGTTSTMLTGSGGGGGGSGHNNQPAGNGAVGGVGGGGGGGGGATNTSATSGAGGNGGPGFVRVICW